MTVKISSEFFAFILFHFFWSNELNPTPQQLFTTLRLQTQILFMSEQ